MPPRRDYTEPTTATAAHRRTVNKAQTGQNGYWPLKAAGRAAFTDADTVLPTSGWLLVTDREGLFATTQWIYASAAMHNS